MGLSVDPPCMLYKDILPGADCAGPDNVTVPDGGFLQSKAIACALALAFAFAMAAFYGTSTLFGPVAETPVDTVSVHAQSRTGLLPADALPAGLAEARECIFVGSVTTVLEPWKFINKIFYEVVSDRDPNSWYLTSHYHFALPPGASPSITISFRRLII